MGGFGLGEDAAQRAVQMEAVLVCSAILLLFISSEVCLAI